MAEREIGVVVVIDKAVTGAKANRIAGQLRRNMIMTPSASLARWLPVLGHVWRHD
jgi:hypothetical protein